MATTAQYAAQPFIDSAQISTANTGRDGTGTISSVSTGVGTAGAGVGKRINRVTVKATGTTTAGMVRFFYSPDGGTTKRLLTEVVVSAITVAASTAAYETTVSSLIGLVLPSSNDVLMASTEKAETFNIIVEGGLL